MIKRYYLLLAMTVFFSYSQNLFGAAAETKTAFSPKAHAILERLEALPASSLLTIILNWLESSVIPKEYRNSQLPKVLAAVTKRHHDALSRALKALYPELPGEPQSVLLPYLATMFNHPSVRSAHDKIEYLHLIGCPVPAAIICHNMSNLMRLEKILRLPSDINGIFNTNFSQVSPLMEASRRDKAPFNMLLAYGAKANAIIANTGTCFHFLAHEISPSWPEAIPALIARGGNIDLVCPVIPNLRDVFWGKAPEPLRNFSALQVAAYNVNATTVKALLDHQADPDSAHSSDIPPLLLAIHRPGQDHDAVLLTVVHLINAGSDVSVRAGNGLSLSEMAQTNGYALTAALLARVLADRQATSAWAQSTENPCELPTSLNAMILRLACLDIDRKIPATGAAAVSND